MAFWRRAIGQTQAQGGGGAFGVLFRPSASYGNRSTTTLLILEQGRNPTTDYYLRPRLPPPDRVPTRVVDLSTDPSSVPLADGTFLIVVRYLNGTWARHLRRHRDRLSGAAYFMDDDLPVARQDGSLPLRYRWKIQRLFLNRLDTLSVLCDRIWVSNAYLADKYRKSGATVLPPLPLAEKPLETAHLTYFYYGSASHAREQTWLVNVVRRVQAEKNNLAFITIGDDAVRKLYADIPRVLVLHPMRWPRYVEALPVMAHHIGLAPLLPSPFNHSRTHTKFFDFTRLGAIGLYSNTTPYAAFIRHDVDGLLLPNDAEAWCQAIVETGRSASLRSRMLEEARKRCNLLAANARPLLDEDPGSSG
jgi:hypothetical protein